MDDNEEPSRSATAQVVSDQPPRRRLGRLRDAVRSPVFVILLLAPFLGEVLSTSATPLYLFLPWNLVLLGALYGCGALLCRELAVRYGLGLRGLFLLAAAYGVYEEALIVRSWFDTTYQDAVGIGAYGRIWGTNLLVATHLTAFHVAVSVGSSIVITERVFRRRRGRPWLGPRGLVVAALALFVLVPLTFGTAYRGPWPQMGVAVVLVIALVGLAFLVPRLPRLPDLSERIRPSAGRAADAEGVARTPHPRLLIVITFLATGVHFLLTYTLPMSWVPWPLAIVVVLLPPALGAVLVRRLRSGGFAGPDTLPIMTGVLSFFLLLDAVIGLGGRYDLVVAAVVTAVGLWWLNRRDDPALA